MLCLLLQLILPFLDLEIKYYDLGLENRDATNDGTVATMSFELTSDKIALTNTIY